MKTLLLSLVILLTAVPMFAQPAVNEVTIEPGDEPSRAFPYKEKYRFADFQMGYITTREGKRSRPLLLNYNIYSGVPQFINEKGDTLFLDEHIAKYVQINDVTYLYEFSKGYYELLSKSTPVKLGLHQKWRRARVESMQTDPWTGRPTKALSRSHQDNQIYSEKHGRVVRNLRIVYQKDMLYHFVDTRDRIYKANEANLFRLFSSSKRQIQEWLQTNPVDFEREDDLLKLLQFCASVSK